MEEIEWLPDFEPPKDAELNPYGVDRRGIMSWKNKGNGFFVTAVHCTADPAKRSKAWFAEATKVFKPWQIEREWNISFKSRAGAKAFGYLLDDPGRWRVPNMDLAKIPKNWRIVAGLDYGTTNPTSIHFYAIDPMRRIYSVYEFYKPSNVREIAKVLKGVHQGPDIDGVWRDYRHPLWKRCEKLVVDGAIYNKNQETGGEEMTSVGDLLEEQGIYGIERATKAREAGLARLHDMFAPNLADKEQRPSLFFCEGCEWQWKEFTSLVYAELPEHALLNKNLPEDIVPKDDHCFAAGTMIATPGGEVAIESIRKGDFVLTRNGPKRVVSCGRAGTEPTFTMIFSGGEKFRCTANHPIWTNNRGFVRSDDLGYEDICVARLKEKKSFSAGLFFADIRNLAEEICANISGATASAVRQAFFTVKSGSLTMAPSPSDTTYIIAMGIPLTTKSPILNASPLRHTYESTAKNLAPKETPLLQKTDFLQRGGTPQAQDGHGIPGTQKEPCIAPKRRKWIAQLVVAALRLFFFMEQPPSFAQTSAGHDLGANPASMMLTRLVRLAGRFLGKIAFLKRRPADVCVVRLCARLSAKVEPVFNLTVEGEHEYFANGILVSNSYDETRYVVMSVAAPSDQMPEPEPEAGTLGEVEREMELEDAERGEIDYY